MRYRQSGFTLIELMITVAIVAILAAVAYPSYMGQIRRSNRTDARNALLQVQLAQEKYFLSNNSYGTLAQLNSPTVIAGLSYSSPTYYSANKFYTVTVTPTTPTTTYTVTATPVTGGTQSKDSCVTFSIDQSGSRSASNPDCWGK